MRLTLLPWLLWAAIVLGCIAGGLWLANAQTMPNAAPTQPEVQWNDAHCIIEKPLLLQLANQAALAENYAGMCGWGGNREP